MTDEEIIMAAAARCGNVRRLARTLGVHPMAAYKWSWRKRLPAGWRAYLSEKIADPDWPKKPQQESAIAESATEGGAG
jgi:transposase-like protein